MKLNRKSAGLVEKSNVPYSSRKQVYVISSCKNIDILDVETILPWVMDCIHRHKKRYDFRKMLIQIGGMTRKQYCDALKNPVGFMEPARKIAEEAIRRIKSKDLELKPINVKTRIDKSSGKVREIGCEDAMQQIFDFIAVGAADEIFQRRIVPQQWSSVKGRGPSYGVRMIQNWIQKDNRAARYAEAHGRSYSRKCVYFVVLDIRHLYESIKIDVFLRRFRKDCGNNTLYWLWEELLRTFPNGLLIGSAISQWAAQYIMSYLYRHVMSLHTYRRGKQISLTYASGMYMDDTLLIGPNRKNLKMAARSLTKYAWNEFGLTVKPNWQICRLEDTPIDMMGYQIYANGKVSVRPRVFLRARRMFLRTDKTMAYRQAQRILSYKGYFTQESLKLSNYKLNRKYQINKKFIKAQKIISGRNKHANKNLQQCPAGANPVYASAEYQ